MKKLNRYLLILICVVSANLAFAKQGNLLSALFDDEEDSSEVVISSIPNTSSVPVQDDQNNTQELYNDYAQTQQSPCELLDLLFDENEFNNLFPDKNEKYYRGQFAVMKLPYIDNSVCDKEVPQHILDARPIDQNILTPEEKEVVKKYYRLTKQQYESPWYMKFISKKLGYGIYAAADIEPGQLIAEYVGIIYDEETYLSRPRDSRYCWNLQPPLNAKNGQKFYVCAFPACNFTRIINHSYNPNVIPVPMHGPDGSRMLYVACEKIKKDEQLLVNYGSGYWQLRGEPEELRGR